MNDNNGVDNATNSPDQSTDTPPVNDFQFTPLADTPESTSDSTVSSTSDTISAPAEDTEAIDPLSELDAEPSTQPVEPAASPFSDAAFDPEPHQQTTEPAQPAAPQAVSVTVNAASEKSSKKPKKNKPVKQPKAPKQPKPTGTKQRRTLTVVLSVVITLLVLAAIAAALWYFVFQPKETTPDTTVKQPAQTTEQPTPATSAELIIDEIQTALHSDLDELYEDMTIDTSSTDSTTPVTGPAYQVDGANYSVRTDQTYSLSVTRSANGEVISSDTDFTKAVIETSTETLTKHTYAKSPSTVDDETIYETDAVICSLTDNVPMVVACADKSAYQTVSDSVKPFAAAYQAGAGESGQVAFGMPQTSDSKTQGYELAQLPATNSMALFYRQNGGDWQYFSSTQQMLTCDAYNTDELKAAYAGEQCLDPKSETNKPTTVEAYVAAQPDDK